MHLHIPLRILFLYTFAFLEMLRHARTVCPLPNVCLAIFFFLFFFLFLLFHILVQVTHSLCYFSILVNKQCMYVYMYFRTLFSVCVFLGLLLCAWSPFLGHLFLDGGSLPVHFHIKTPHIFRLSSFFFSCSSFFLLQGRRNV